MGKWIYIHMINCLSSEVLLENNYRLQCDSENYLRCYPYTFTEIVSFIT